MLISFSYQNWEEGREVYRKNLTRVKKNGKSPPGSSDNPLVFKGTASCRSELLSDHAYPKGAFILVGERAVYRITGQAEECSGTYRYSYPAKPIGFI